LKAIDSTKAPPCDMFCVKLLLDTHKTVHYNIYVNVVLSL